MYSYYYQQQDMRPSINVSGQQTPGFYFSNAANLTPEFLPSVNQPLFCCHHHPPPSTSSSDFYQNNNMIIPFDGIHTKPEYMNNQQQSLHSEISLTEIQNYLSSISYEDVHMMPAPPATIPASPLSSAFSSSSSPQMDDFLSMDNNNNGSRMAEYQYFVSPPPFSPITKKATRTPNKCTTTATKKKGQSIIHIKANNNDAMIKKKKKRAMLPQLGEFFCEFEGCGKVFGRKYNLSSHLVSHYAERKFFCDHCPKAFVRRHDLKRHMRIHTGETPHKCLYCDRGFGRADALQRHYLTDNTCTLFYNNDPVHSLHKKKARSTGFGAKA